VIDGLRAAAFWPYLQDMRKLTNDCKICSNPDFAKDVRPIWGCDGDSTEKGFAYQMGDVKSRRCPLSQMKHPGIQTIITCFKGWKKGILPRPGGLRMQTAYFISAIQFCEGFENSATGWYHKQLEKQSKKGN